ncbi:hypothetical protein TH66_13485 [Carbonactinospora thermoautotrophica]|uniref:Pycsar effector protein domain-containing protein n=1 Tax=Carbonactinospora thermoautotrophica TaxID=1469144 RepID=A0A132NKJ9_9ACTN|nr:hypothetical protein [Carbonactinospora thermoautotrophica]KWX03792.1 hypothetical protein TH66_13485 [Carbonactinospora thermoautotrophica]KWX10473.1 hypothetical protein TR74_03390 [Carbonactinospora thermoautotrophica]
MTNTAQESTTPARSGSADHPTTPRGEVILTHPNRAGALVDLYEITTTRTYDNSRSSTHTAYRLVCRGCGHEQTRYDRGGYGHWKITDLSTAKREVARHAEQCGFLDPREHEQARLAGRLAEAIREARADHTHANTTAGLLLALAGLAIANPDKLPGGPLAAAGYAAAYTAIALLLATFVPRTAGHPALRRRRQYAAEILTELREGPDPIGEARRVRETARITVRKYTTIRTAVALLALALALFGLAALTG